jgi:hypothetical protein
VSSDFMGGGGRGVQFENIGDSVTGILLAEPEKRVQTDMSTGEPKLFKDGSVKTMYAVRLQTGLRDPGDPFDTGERMIYLKWKSLEAVQQAIRRAGAPGPQVGGQLTLTLIGLQEPAQRGWSKVKVWAAEYVPPPEGQQFMAEGQQYVHAGTQNALQPTAAPAWTPPPGSHTHVGVAPTSAAPVSPGPVPYGTQASMLERLKQQQQAGIGRLPGGTSTQDQEPPF